MPSPRAPLSARSASPPPPPVNTVALFAELIEKGTLSATPRASPWSVDSEGSDLDVVRAWISSALPMSEVRGVYRVECSAVTAAAYTSVMPTLGPQRLLWHGTPWASVANIAQTGFNRAYCGRHGVRLGKGSYFAEDAAYAARFCGRAVESRAIFLAGILPGRFCRGEAA